MLNEPLTISFIGTRELKELLEEWAKADDRSVSYIIRKALENEAERRAALKAQEEKNGH